LSAQYGTNDFDSSIDDACTIAKLLKDAMSNDRLTEDVICTVEGRKQADHTDGSVLDKLAKSPSNIAILLIAYHNNRPSVGITRLLEKARYVIFLFI
jgi:hypothetical protein